MKSLLEKLWNLNTNEYKASVKQVSGSLQIGDLTISAKSEKQLDKRLRNSLKIVLDILSDFNEKIDNGAIESKPKKQKKQKEEKPPVKGLE